MRLMHHCLGVGAKLNATLARYRVNFVPLNTVLIAGLGIWAASLWHDTVDGVRNAQTPAAVSVDQIQDQGGTGQKYVRISGLLKPTVVYRYEDGIKTNWWSPLVDPGGSAAVLVHRSGTIDPELPHPVVITGMLRSLHAEARIHLASSGSRTEGVPIDEKYELVEGERPARPLWVGPAAMLTSAAFLILCLVWCAGNVVFRPQYEYEKSAFQRPWKYRQLPVGATGKFAFDAETERKFIDLPAVLTSDRGQATICSCIDASERFMGAVTARRKGIWYIQVHPGSVRRGRFGSLYFGLARRHAFRFHYVDARNGKSRIAVLTADEPVTLLDAAAHLTGLA